MPKKLLLVEDSVTIRKMFELAFAQSDVAITAVDNGDDAVRLAREISPDLVVADVTLQGKDGYAIAAELRAVENTKDIPVLILSGSLIPLDEQRFRTSRASAVLFKPFDSQELMEKVDGLMRTRAEAPPAGAKTVEPSRADEHWDFSDVLEEVETEGKQAGTPAVSQKREEIFPGVLLTGGGKADRLPLNEYDVSFEEIGGEQMPKDRAIPPVPPEPHLEGSLVGDAPPAVTDLAKAFEPEEEIEEMEAMEEVEFPPEAPPAGPAAAPPVWVVPSAPAPVAVTAAPAPEEIPSAPAPVAHVPPAPAASPAGEGALFDAALREQFSVRAEEIFRTVATETVEKVMWEVMDRLAADFSGKVREAVEAVAWEVIPATAEAIIREEISRIREQAGKLSS